MLRYMIFCTFFVSLSFSSSLLSFDHQHRQWQKVLDNFLQFKDGQSYFDYQGLKRRPKLLDLYLVSLSTIKIKDYFDFSKRERLAFLINAYNAFTVKLILDNYPISSIRDIGGIFSNPWKIKFFEFLGIDNYLDNIEHNMIRKNFNEPRIHFALNCASLGCPSLQKFAFRAYDLKQQLEIATENFLSNRNKNAYLREGKKLIISKIFKWYAEDFVKKFGSVENFLAPYLTDNQEDLALIKAQKVIILYNDYEWNLNQKSNI